MKFIFKKILIKIENFAIRAEPFFLNFFNAFKKRRNFSLKKLLNSVKEISAIPPEVFSNDFLNIKQSILQIIVREKLPFLVKAISAALIFSCSRSSLVASE